MKEKLKSYFRSNKIEILRDISNFVLLIIGVGGLIYLITINYFSTTNIQSVDSKEIYAQNNEVSDKKYIDIQGQIKTPGVYEISRGEIIFDIIERAGGYSEDADRVYIQDCINLSEKVKDEQKIFIPSIQEMFSCSSTSSNVPSNNSSSNVTGSVVSINNGTLEELDTLPGIGPSTAQKIIDARPFGTVEDLMNVPGIGDSTFEKLKEYIEL